jgi:hypothetical protein
MIRGLGRKGDVTITTIILIVLGLFVLVMMILGFTKGWDFIFKPFSNAPSELQTLAKACEVYAQGSLSIDFCQYRLIGKELVNCRDSRIIASLNADGVNYGSDSLKCASELSDDGKKNACGNADLVPVGKRGSIRIGGTGSKTCAELVGVSGSLRCVVKVNGCDNVVQNACIAPGCEWDFSGNKCVVKVNGCDNVVQNACIAPGCEWE